jgi:hypothetical protein
MTYNVGQELPRRVKKHHAFKSAIDAEQVNLRQRVMMCLVVEIASRTSLHDRKDRFWDAISDCSGDSR